MSLSGGRGLMTRSHWPLRSMSTLGTLDDSTRSVTPGAWVRNRASSGGNSTSRRRSLAAIVTVAPSPCGGQRAAVRKLNRQCSQRLYNALVATIPRQLIIMPQPVMAFSFIHWWLTADCGCLNEQPGDSHVLV